MPESPTPPAEAFTPFPLLEPSAVMALPELLLLPLMHQLEPVSEHVMLVTATAAPCATVGKAAATVTAAAPRR